MIIKITQLFLVSVMTMTSLAAQSTIEGMWNTGKDNTIVQMYEKDGAWYGKIVSSDNAKAELGIDILRRFKQKRGGWKGKLYAPKRGRSLKAEIVPSENKLSVTIFAGLSKRKVEWKRE